MAPSTEVSDNYTYKVKNVKNVTQLPLTGAAGTTLFTVVALLVAGAGVTVALKSRQRVR
ncbi:LPXTG cell wall anchor domain-containing protein [Bifidobacterium pseudocatenulatum]|nr:LPXTG cell wall anchor domain-containing protein [Bifidobacterium pseudocatenulatum]MDB6498668.1 LPXTG cell wall anchor domain-containing protein [Bifidobacterium pseudocatenulatum]MDB6505922.1 LPXTG cell wall anchor domain-containing protein [Bifidobacterium pseudocatenulatum]